MSYHEIEITILGGLEVTIGFTIDPAEHDVGISESYVRDWDIVAVKNKPIKWNGSFAKALYNRICKAGEYVEVEQKLIDGVY